jgi:spore germination protein KB
MFLNISSKSDKTFFETMQIIFGKVVAKILFFIYFIYFTLNTFAVTESLFLYLSEHLYFQYNWAQYIFPLFLMIMFVSSTDLSALVRTIQFFIPFIILSVLLSIFLSSLNCDFSNCLPLFENGLSNSLNIFDYSFWFGDGLIMVLFFGKIDRKKSIKPIIISIVVMSILVSFFFLVFYCVFETDTINNKEAITDVLRVLPQNSDVVNVNWVITLLWQLALLVYICLYSYISRIFLEGLFNFHNAKVSVPIVLMLVLASLLVINFDMSKLLFFLVNYAKYFAILCHYVLPVIIFITSLFRLRRKNEKAIC